MKNNCPPPRARAAQGTTMNGAYEYANPKEGGPATHRGTDYFELVSPRRVPRC